ncbi:MAG: hypothetical protein H6Q31_966 [Bacteroidetes bacterium]|nr:hypothetical protein [Bacteroidota bacterium]
MSRSCVFLSWVALAVCAVTAQAQQAVQPDSLGLPGDNLNLYAVLTVFQQSPTLEEFEKRLNSDSLNINNLDLNGDQRIDYIRVYNYVVDNGHNIVLQVDLSESQSQDVAVIEVKQTSENRVYVQIIGDEALYGKDYIIEPNYDPASETAEGTTANPGYTGSTVETGQTFDGRPVVIITTTPFHVARWRLVRHLYEPGYRPWHSPWHYSYYPPWWRPWRPYYWHSYWGYQYKHHHYYWAHFRRWEHYRQSAAYGHYYRHMRAQAPVVIERVKKNAYRDMYSRPDLKKEGLRRYEKQNPSGPWKPETRAAERKPDAGRQPTVRPGGPVTTQPPADRQGEGKSGATPPKETRPTQPIGTRPSTGGRTLPTPTPTPPSTPAPTQPGGPVTTQPPADKQGSSEAPPPKATSPTPPRQPAGTRPSGGERTSPTPAPTPQSGQQPGGTQTKETKPPQPAQPAGTRPSTGERTGKPTPAPQPDQKRDQITPPTTRESNKTAPADTPPTTRKR